MQTETVENHAENTTTAYDEPDDQQPDSVKMAGKLIQAESNRHVDDHDIRTGQQQGETHKEEEQYRSYPRKQGGENERSEELREYYNRVSRISPRMILQVQS